MSPYYFNTCYYFNTWRVHREYYYGLDFSIKQTDNEIIWFWQRFVFILSRIKIYAKLFIQGFDFPY